MRRLVVTSLLIACAGLTAGCGLLEAEAEKPELKSLETFKGKGYRIKLPCIPAEGSEKVAVPDAGSLTMRTWACEDDDSAYILATIALPADVQANLDGAAQGAADAVDGKVVSNAPVTYAGSPGRDIRIESEFDGDPATVFTRVIVRKRVMYQVEVVVLERTKKPPALYRKVLKSLTFK